MKTRHLTLIAILLACAPASLRAADPVVANVVSAQRAGTKLVDIDFDVSDADSDQLTISVEVSDDGGSTFAVPVSALSGPTSVSATPVASSHALVWDAGVDFNQQFSSSMVVRVVAEDASPPTGMALVPGGAFNMGDASGAGQSDELPVHAVEIGAFYIDRFEVTKALWDSVRAWGVANGYTDLPTGEGQGSNHPVQNVSWYGVVKWCNVRSEKEGLTPVYYTSDTHIAANVYKTGTDDLAENEVNWSASGYRLPTEAEWEKAARGTLVGNAYPWGSAIADGDANYDGSDDPFESESPGTTPVGFYDGQHWAAYPTDRANGYGLYDMAGNVSERCWDWFDDDWYESAGATAADTRGPASSPVAVRAVRGGSWLFNSLDTRCARRSAEFPGGEVDFVGFRTARGL